MDLKAVLSTSTFNFLVYWTGITSVLLCLTVLVRYLTHRRERSSPQREEHAIMASPSTLDSKKRLALAIIDFLSTSLKGPFDVLQLHHCLNLYWLGLIYG